MEEQQKKEIIINVFLFFRKILNTIVYTIYKIINAGIKIIKDQI